MSLAVPAGVGCCARGGPAKAGGAAGSCATHDAASPDPPSCCPARGWRRLCSTHSIQSSIGCVNYSHPGGVMVLMARWSRRVMSPSPSWRDVQIEVAWHFLLLHMARFWFLEGFQLGADLNSSPQWSMKFKSLLCIYHTQVVVLRLAVLRVSSLRPDQRVTQKL